MSQQIPDLNPFATWSDGQLTSWHRAVEELAHDAWAELGEDDWSIVSEGLEKARLASKIDKDLEDAFHRLWWKTLRIAAVYGFALGRTWPAGFEEMEAWPGKAWALAGFKPHPAREASNGT